MKIIQLAIRTLCRFKIYTIINIIGLALSMACVIIIFRYVEQSYRLGNQNDYGHRRSCGDYFGISYFKKFLPDYQDTRRNRQ